MQVNMLRSLYHYHALRHLGCLDKISKDITKALELRFYFFGKCHSLLDKKVKIAFQGGSTQ